MSKGFRVLLQILQVICLLGALVFLASSLLLHVADFDLPVLEATAPVESWAVAFGVLAVALSPALWSLSRLGSQAPAGSSTGSFDRVPPAVPAQAPPSQAGSVFEPMNTSQAPAPPASSYGQPSAGFGGAPSQPQASESPWGSGR